MSSRWAHVPDRGVTFRPTYLAIRLLVVPRMRISNRTGSRPFLLFILFEDEKIIIFSRGTCPNEHLFCPGRSREEGREYHSRQNSAYYGDRGGVQEL